MIKYLKADNYRTFVNFKVDFSNINMLLGNNGVGKSTIFELLYNLRSFIRGDKTVKDVFSFESLTRWQNVPVQSFELGISYDSFDFVYMLEIEYNKDIKKNKVKRESVLCEGRTIFHAENGKATLYNDSYSEGPELLMNWLNSGVSAVYERSDNKKLCSFKTAINNIVVCHPSPVNVHDYCNTEEQYPDYNTENIVSVYLSVVQTNLEKITTLWEMMRQINPSFCRTYLKGETEKTLYFEYNHSGAITEYKFSEISDGERMIFILYFLIAAFSKDNYSLFLDEPDNYISLQEVVQLIQHLQDTEADNGQFVIISHHPKIIDYFATSYGIWLTRRSYGATSIAEPPVATDYLTYSEIIASGDGFGAE